jgi:hypothetical protein
VLALVSIRRRRSVLVGSVLVTTLAAGRAEANQCNLYQPQQFGQYREGCAITIFSLPDVDPLLPSITRNGQPVEPTIVQDELVLKVGFEHYATPDSCYLLPPEYENKAFERYVLTYPDLKGGDEIIVDRYGSYTVVVPGPGDCGVVDPIFWCQDGIQFCDDPYPPDPDHEDDSDLGGCSAGRGSTSGLAIFTLLALVRVGRRSRRS